MQSKKNYRFIVKITPDLIDNFGHVNNAHYLELYERARWDILEQCKLGRDYVERSGKGPVILEVNIRFSREMKEGESITIETTSRRKGNRLFYFDQVMKNKNGEKCSEAVFTAALFDLDKRKMISADEKWLKAFGF